MDLAEIRKKAQQQTANAEDKALLEPSVAAELIEEELEPEFSLPEAEQPVGGLQQFFPELDFASEEDYIQGISGNESSLDVDTLQWLTFLLGDEEYALSLDMVLELIKPRSYTDLPDVPDYVRGILSLRGEVVPVVDLMARFGLGKAKESSYQRIIVCEGQDQWIGLLVDRITQVVRLPNEAVEQAPLVIKEAEQNFVSGVGRYQGRMLILLNPDEVIKL
jgi:purine-binding chemotaxis protein CheW